jgi:hypothetical protein
VTLSSRLAQLAHLFSEEDCLMKAVTAIKKGQEIFNTYATLLCQYLLNCGQIWPSRQQPSPLALWYVIKGGCRRF